MRNKNQKGRCEKRKLEKCEEICKTYDAVQYACADMLANQEEIIEIQCNVLLEGLDEKTEYTSDFVCRRENGDMLVRECVFRKNLSRPSTARLLELSRQYWLRRGIDDWRIVIDAEK